MLFHFVFLFRCVLFLQFIVAKVIIIVAVDVVLAHAFMFADLLPQVQRAPSLGALVQHLDAARRASVIRPG